MKVSCPDKCPRKELFEDDFVSYFLHPVSPLKDLS